MSITFISEDQDQPEPEAERDRRLRYLQDRERELVAEIKGVRAELNWLNWVDKA
jgi:hypothetical protein